MEAGLTMSSHPMVLRGREGWLFLSNDTNSVIDQITGKIKLPENFIENWSQLFEYRRENLDKLKTRYFLSIVPNKECVYSDFLPDGIECSSRRPIYDVIKVASGVIDYRYMLDDLRPVGSRGQTFIKGDTHWNYYGALLAFNALMEQNGLAPLPEEALRFVDLEYNGDLASKVGEKTSLRHGAVIKKNFKRVDSNDLRNIGQRVIFENNDKNLPTLVLFRDSFTTSQLDMFATKFSRVVCLWQPNIDYGIVRQEKPDFVISQHVERFFVQCPDDRFGLSHLEHEKQKKAAS